MPRPDKISITIDNKILLHILAVGQPDEKEEIPITLTQSGMADDINVPLGSISRALKKLVDLGLLVEKLYHVRGKKRRMSAYFLTLTGQKHIMEFQEKFSSKSVKVKEKTGDINFLPISQLLNKLDKKANLIDIINHIQKQGFYDEELFGQILQERMKPSHKKGLLVKHLERMPKIRQFFDRNKEQNYLIKNIKSSKIIVIHGMAGIGKSTLAAKFVERFLDSRNIFWYRFQEWDTIRNLLMPLADYLAEMDRNELKSYLDSNQNIEYYDVINIIKSDLHGSNSLIILDDLHRASDRIIQFFRSFTENLEKIENVNLIVLSRSLIRFYDRRDVTIKLMIREMRLNGLDKEGSRELVKPKALDKSGFNRIYQLTKGHPLALELIDSVDDLKHPSKDLMKFVHEEIFSKLEQDEKNLLNAISIYRGPVHSDAIFMEDSMDFETLDKLIQKALLFEVGPSLYEVHDIIREFFYSRINPKKRKEYHHQAAKYYKKVEDELAFLESTYHLLQSGNQDEAAKLIIDRAPTVIDRGFHEEVMNILTSFDHTLNIEYLSQIYKLKGQILDIWGEWDNIFEYYYQCWTLSNYLQKDTDFKLDQETLHNTIGFMSWKPIEVDTALENLQSSLKTVEEVNDEIGMNEISRSLGWVFWLKGDYKNAIRSYEKSLKGLKKVDFKTDEISANIYINLGNIFWEQRKWEKAIDYFRKSVDMFKELNNQYKISRLYNNIGCVYAEKGELEKALNFFNKGILLSENIFYVRGKAYTLLHQGECFIRKRQFQDAQKALEDALEIFTKIEDYLGMVYSKINIGIIHYLQHDWKKARDYYLSCVEVLTDLDANFYLGEVYLGLYLIFSNLKNMDLANEFRNNAKNTFKQIMKSS